MDPNEDHIDRILAHEEEMLPSSGFAASVMGAVRREAAVPAPIPFPWKRAWPILALAAAAVVAVPIAALIVILRSATTPVLALHTGELGMWERLPGWMSNPAAAWTTGSLLLALILVKFSMRMASR